MFGWVEAFDHSFQYGKPVTQFVPKGAVIGTPDLDQEPGSCRFQQFGEQHRFFAAEVERLMGSQVHNRILFLVRFHFI